MNQCESGDMGEAALKAACRAETGGAPSKVLPHISVCVCTFRRPALLSELLHALLKQVTEGRFTFSIVVVDNDAAGSGRQAVEDLQKARPGTITYSVEPEQSIAAARNMCLARAQGELIAFIDDDETPTERWLLLLYEALLAYGADGVLGPVDPRFAVQPPEWIMRAGVFDRPNSSGWKTGLVLHWRQTGTGNVLIRRRVVEALEGPFRLQFGSGGEDLDFFRRAMDKGRVFVWCEEATAYETVPLERTRVSFQLRRALLRGKMALSRPSSRGLGILKSVAAVTGYSALLPFLLLCGRHVFLRYLIKDCDHAGKLLAFFGISPVRQKYIVK